MPRGQSSGNRALAHLLAALSIRDTKASKRANFCRPRHDLLSQNNIYLIDKLKMLRS